MTIHKIPLSKILPNPWQTRTQEDPELVGKDSIMTVATRVEKIEGVLEDRHEHKRDQVEMRLAEILSQIRRYDEELILDGLIADARGEEGPEGWKEAFERLQSKGFDLALDNLEELLTPQEREARAERYRQLVAGEDWRQLRRRKGQDQRRGRRVLS